MSTLPIVLFLTMFAAVNPGRARAADAGWHGDNLKKIQQFIKESGRSSAGYDAAKKPVAVFDWDNTVIKNDVGDAALYWMLAHDLVRKPSDWKLTSPYLTAPAAAALEKNCKAGSSGFITTSDNPGCADVILSIYGEGTLPDGTAAWDGRHNSDLLNPAYAWPVALMAGYTPGEVRKMAGKAIKFNLGNSEGAVQKLGSKERAAWMRVYPRMAELITALKENGFDVWVVSASCQYIVEAFARRVGVAADHVIGIRPALKEGRVDYGLEACGSNPAGGSSLVTYKQGKRCWINKVIFGEKDPGLMLSRPSPIVFGAGDADTDIFFLKDAAGLRLAINRNRREIMCNAYANSDGKWLINPMFIDPLPRYGAGYKCSDLGLPDQEDSVF